jgi:glycosyltransferase involved in cell wall biosynthesis
MKIAVLAEQNFNLIDGSTIWLLNLCKLLALQPDFEITLLLSHPLRAMILAQELPARIRIVDATAIRRISDLDGENLTPATVTDNVLDLERAEGRFERIVVRGSAYLAALLAAPALNARIVAYAPAALPDLALPEPDWLSAARALRTPLIVQSATAKSALESLCDYPAHVVHVVPPIVFEADTAGEPIGAGSADDVPADGAAAAAPAQLCYSGKIDPEYGLDWLLDFCQQYQNDKGISVSLIAGKDTYRTRHPDFFAAMDRFRRETEAGAFAQVTLVTGVPHAEARATMGRADFAYCLRHPRYDDVIEISTKIVEFCAAGVPPILNDTALNRALFGTDYPYLLREEPAQIPARLRQILAGIGGADHIRAKARCAEIAAQFSAQTLSGALARAVRGHDGTALVTNPRRVLIASHDGKFLQHFLDRAKGDPAIQIIWQPWATTTKPASPPTVPEDVDTVFCEWCCENAVWHSQNKRKGTKLIVRLHRFEAFRDFPVRVNWAAVDTLIVVSDHFRDIMVDQYGVNPARIHVMPQYIDWPALQRPKLAEARFHLGLVGINPFDHKRFDRAIDFLAALRAQDPRFQLVVRSLMPWQIDWVWENRSDHRAQFLEVFRRIYTEPLLRGAVRFDPAGPDMEEWYRGIGTILSSSDSEGCHTSVIEGMASGCYPVVHDWPGARSLFTPYVHKDITDAISDVIAFADQPDLAAARGAISARMQPHDVMFFASTFFSL